MKLITRDVDYAMRAIACMAGCGDRVVTVSELSASLKIPKPFLRKILQVLNSKKILRSYKGKRGGFYLAGPTAGISLLDIIKIFQGDFRLNDHFFRGGTCPNFNACALRKELDVVEEQVAGSLDKIMLDVLLKECHPDRSK